MAFVYPNISSDVDPLAPHFGAWRAAGRRALIPYVTAGYPAPGATPEVLDTLARSGADVIELGVPFSDPVADGPTIQRSSQRALEHGVRLVDVLGMVRDFRADHATPVVLFTYLNPLLRWGGERFVAEAAAAGAQGVLVTDLPVGSDAALEEILEASSLSLIRLVAPTTPPRRVAEIARRAQGFLYYVARLGVTGASVDVRQELAAELERLRATTRVPLAVGFGISTPEHAAAVGRMADGVVVGSALIDALDQGGLDDVAELLGGLREALDGLGPLQVPEVLPGDVA